MGTKTWGPISASAVAVVVALAVLISVAAVLALRRKQLEHFAEEINGCPVTPLPKIPSGLVLKPKKVLNTIVPSIPLTEAEKAKQQAWMDKTPTGPDNAARIKSPDAEVVASMMESAPAPPGTFRPCEVYFTDNMKVCDSGQYKYHPAYYKTKLADLRAAIGDRPPSAEESKEIVRLNRILADYKTFPDGINCKTALPNWKELVGDKRTPYIANNVHNRERGNKAHWAFCWRPVGTPDGTSSDPASEADTVAKIEATGMIIQKVAGQLQGRNIDNVFHVRGTFDDDISVPAVKKTYCAESAGKAPYYIKAALVIEDASNKPKFAFYKNDVPTAMTNDDIERYWRYQFFDQKASTAGNIEKVYAKPLMQPKRLVKMSKDLCDRKVDDYSTIATIKFGDDIFLATTTLGQGSDFLRGTMTDIENRILGNNRDIASLQAELAELYAKLAKMRADLAALQNQYNAAKAQHDRANAEYRDCINSPFKSISGWWGWYQSSHALGRSPAFRVYVDAKTGKIGRSPGRPESMFGEYFYRDGTLRHRRWFWGSREYIFGVRQHSDGKLYTENTPAHWLLR